MTITAALVKDLRARTGAGMMECKNMLVETGGDLELAVEELRKRGAAQADKKAGRIAAEGIVIALIEGRKGVTVEVNCETDFVAIDENFVTFANLVANSVLQNNPANLVALSASSFASSGTIEELRQALVAKIGENISIRRFAVISAGEGEVVGAYQHGSKISVLVKLAGGTDELAKDIAMHVAASRPVYVSADEVPADLLAKEREIFAAQAAKSGKSAEIVEKMIDGRIRKYLDEVTLLGQSFIKDPDQTMDKLVQSAGARVQQFVRYEVGEGIEKKQDDFVSEVMAQAAN